MAIINLYKLLAPLRHPQILLFIPICGIYLATENIWRSYSYWLDELISVTVSQLSLSESFIAILNDVHPPLYQLTLSAWLNIFGESEFSSRSLSLACALSAFIYLASWAKRLELMEKISILVFFSSSYLFPYYAQEARPYAMLLLFSTVLTCQFLEYDGSNNKFIKIIIMCLLTGFAHYFGMLLSGIVLCWMFFVEKKLNVRLLLISLTLVALIAWPIAQYLYGGLGNKAGGSFWIQVNGPLDTFAIIYQSLWQDSPIYSWRGLFELAVIVIVLYSAFLFYFRNRGKSNDQLNKYKQYYTKLAFIFFSVVTLATLADLHTPISTVRNYIALLPAIAIFFGMAIFELYQSPRMGLICVIFLALWGAARLWDCYHAMTYKWTPVQNWKKSSEFMQKSVNSQMHYYYIQSGHKDQEAMMRRVFNFYVKKHSNGEINLTRIGPADLNSLSQPYVILFWNPPPNFIENVGLYFKKDHVGVFYPVQSSIYGTGVVYSITN